MSEESQSDPDAISRLFAAHAEELTRFVTGMVGDVQLARDAVQTSFAKLVESGGPDKEESRKAWLFRVAYNEALAVKRRGAIGHRVHEGLRWIRSTENPAADATVVRQESIDAVQEAISELPETQRQVVRLRIYEEMTFAEIAEQLEIPLGTALTRMRTAMQKLRTRLRDE